MAVLSMETFNSIQAQEALRCYRVSQRLMELTLSCSAFCSIHKLSLTSRTDQTVKSSNLFLADLLIAHKTPKAEEQQPPRSTFQQTL